MNNKKRIVIVGATSAIAEHCARLWVKDSKVDLTLLGRNLSKTENLAADLRVRSPQSDIHVVVADFINPFIIREEIDKIFIQGPVHTVLIAHGSLSDQLACQKNLNTSFNELIINGISPALFAEIFIENMQKTNYGTVAIISSVAGDRGRKSNYVYGAAKGLVTRYAQGLQHRLTKSGVKVVLIKPGPTDTPMTRHLKQQGERLAKVEDVASLIVRGIEQGKAVIYAPKKWKLIMAIITHIPYFVFNRLNI